MLKLVADVNCEGYVRDLLAIARNGNLNEFVEFLDIKLLTFSDLGLAENANDRLVWETLQHNQAILLTNNRNHKGRQSLQGTIAKFNTLEKLPVVTLSNSGRIYADRHYAMLVAQKLIEVLIDIERHRGAGRLYIP